MSKIIETTLGKVASQNILQIKKNKEDIESIKTHMLEQDLEIHNLRRLITLAIPPPRSPLIDDE